MRLHTSKPLTVGLRSADLRRNQHRTGIISQTLHDWGALILICPKGQRIEQCRVLTSYTAGATTSLIEQSFQADQSIPLVSPLAPYCSQHQMAESTWKSETLGNIDIVLNLSSRLMSLAAHESMSMACACRHYINLKA
ncbi:hypothetical protein HOLleu_27103 [Holothuria leucospilota]|uniref:Uncharacterized protein n=1 Tax=Holothuria leucospilota TaxID=206669 RepID=A0A9Q1BQ95_HOLLE|nr:hypothetical protein HOLleu_27103 [Holothuria leucospilota]